MWKSLVVVLVVAMCLSMWFSRAGGQAANPDQPDLRTPQLVPDRTMPDGDLPRRVARDFAPWITAIIQQRTDVANRLFPLKRQVQEIIQSPNALRIFRKFPKLTGMDIAFLGGRTLGDQISVLLFTIATEDGPVAFKIYHYKFTGQHYVGRLEITDDWSEIERMFFTVDILQNPITTPL
ncbi:MAG: hypothetical protein FWD61_10425 [Phycisphaerales bacterium]|nr:hypothetical protein [Phycisphaerales bacterium]